MTNVARLSNDGVLTTSTFDDNTKSSFGVSSNATAYSNEFKEPQVSVINTVSNSTKTDPLTLTGINPGNLVFYVASCDSTESHDFTVPTGFSEVTIVNNSQFPNYIIATKISDGTSVTAQNMTFPSGATAQFMFAVSGVDTRHPGGDQNSSSSNGMPGGAWTTDESKVGSYLFSFGFLDDDIVASSVGVENDLMDSSGTYSNQIFVGAVDAGTSGAGSTLMVAFSKVKNDGGSIRSFSFTGDGDDINGLRRVHYIGTPLRQKSNGSSEVGKIIDETEVFNSIRPNDLELHYNSELSDYLTITTQIIGGYTEFTSSGTFTVPSDVTSLTVVALGGGGGGGNNSSNFVTQNAGGGGGGGGMCISSLSVTAGETLTVTVGSGGAAGGSNGGDSQVLRSSSLLIEGGGGNGGGQGSNSGGSGGSGTNPSGSGATASVQFDGGNGGSGGSGFVFTPTAGGGGGGGAAGADGSFGGADGGNGGSGGNGTSSSVGGGGGGGGTKNGSGQNDPNGGGGGGGGFKNRNVDTSNTAGTTTSASSTGAVLILKTAEVLHSTFSINNVESAIGGAAAAPLTSGTVVNCSFWSGTVSIAGNSSLDNSPYNTSGTGGTNLGTGQFTSDANGNLTLTTGSLPTSAVKSIILQKTQSSPSENFVPSGRWKMFDGPTSGGSGGASGYGASGGGAGYDGDDGSNASTTSGGAGGNYGAGGGGGGGTLSSGSNNGAAGSPGLVYFEWGGSISGHYWKDISGNDRDLTLPFVAQSGDSSSFTAGSASSFPAGISRYTGLKVQFSPKVLPGQTIKIKGLFTGGSNNNIINHVRGDIYYTLGNVSNGGANGGYTTGVNSDTNFYSDLTMIPTSGNSVTNLYRKEVISSYEDFYKSGTGYDLVLRGHTKEVNALLYVQRGFANLAGNSYAFNGRSYMTAPFYGSGAGVVDGDSGNAYTGVTGTGARTIIFSVRPVLLATDSRPFSYGANSSGQRFTCRITSTNKFRVEIGSGHVETTNAVNLTYKNMFAVTCPDSGTVADIKIWINGKEITSLTTSNPTLAINTSSANNVSIGGAEHETFKSYLTGVVDNVMIYSVALNDLEIKNIYNSVVKLLSPFTEDYVAVAGSAPAIITDNLELHLDALNSSSYSGSGTTWNDISGENNNGTITNSSEVVYNSGGWFDWTDGPGFDSTGGYVSLPNTAITLGATYTIEVWNYYDSTSAPVANPFSGGNLWTNSAEDDWNNGSGNNNGLLFGYNSIVYKNTSGTEIEVDYSPVPATQVWHQHVLVVNSGSGTVYVDKTSVGTMSNMRTLGQSNGTLGIGICDKFGTYRGEYLGFISIVRVYPGKALSVSEITQNFNANKDRYGI